jgi:hypothetical protein
MCVYSKVYCIVLIYPQSRYLNISRLGNREPDWPIGGRGGGRLANSSYWRTGGHSSITTRTTTESTAPSSESFSPS